MFGLGLSHGPDARARAYIEHFLGVLDGGKMEFVIVYEHRHVVAGLQVRDAFVLVWVLRSLEIQCVVLFVIIGSPVLSVLEVLKCPPVYLAVVEDGRAEGGGRVQGRLPGQVS